MFKLLSLLGGLVLVLFGVCAFFWISGYESGVKATEVRWREAVGRRGDPGDEGDY